jgi:hypothetical protein
MEILNSWMPTEAASKFLHISVSMMHEMKRTGILKPGEHFYVAGLGISGPMILDVLAVRETLLENTAKKGLRKKPSPEQVETYHENT